MTYDKRIVGKNIRAFRLRYNLSIDDLADMVGLSSSFIGLVERGQRGAKLDNLLKFSKIFNITLNDLILDKDENKALAESKTSALEKKLNTLVTLTHDISEESFDFLIATLRNLKKLKSANIQLKEAETSTLTEKEIKYFANNNGKQV